MDKDRQLLTDIRLKLTVQPLIRPVYEVDTEWRVLPGRSVTLEDIATASGRDNLGQAIMLRLLTPRGEMAPLGHPEYGSRLHELIGSPNTETKRNQAKLFILESLKMEPRIAKVERITVTPAEGNPFLIFVELTVKPIGDAAGVTIGPFTLEL